MSQAKSRHECPVCRKLLAASAIVRHVRIRHPEWYVKFQQDCDLYYASHVIVCPCGKPIPLKLGAFNRWFYAVICVGEEPEQSVVCDRECKHLLKAWNSGLTKNDHPSLMRISEERRGDNNPIHKVINDPVAYAKWCQAISDADVGRHIRGKTYVERYGDERAKEIKVKLSISATNREINGHTGHPHTEKTKREIAIKTIENLKTRQDNVTTKPQYKLYNALVEILGSNRVQLEKQVAWYSLDIVIDDCIDVELDGDFYHVNEARGFVAKYKSQKHNLVNDKKRDKFLSNNNWRIIRIWESDVNENLQSVITKIVGIVNA